MNTLISLKYSKNLLKQTSFIFKINNWKLDLNLVLISNYNKFYIKTDNHFKSEKFFSKSTDPESLITNWNSSFGNLKLRLN